MNFIPLVTHHNIPTTTESAARLKPPKSKFQRIRLISYQFETISPTTFSYSIQIEFPISVNCAWSDWNIGDCSVSCGLGTRSETRKKKIIEKNGGECIGESSLTTECHDQTCPGK